MYFNPPAKVVFSSTKVGRKLQRRSKIPPARCLVQNSETAPMNKTWKSSIHRYSSQASVLFTLSSVFFMSVPKIQMQTIMIIVCRYTFVLYSGYNQYIFVLFVSTGLDEISPCNPSSNDHDLQTPTGRIDLGISTGLC